MKNLKVKYYLHLKAKGKRQHIISTLWVMCLFVITKLLSWNRSKTSWYPF